MVVPPLEMIQKALVQVSSNKKTRELAEKQMVKALQVRAKPGKSSLAVNLDLNYNITEYNPRKMTI
jgi:hypothetical protein